MDTTRNLKRIIAAALLSGSVALAGLGLASGTAQAFNPQPEPPVKPANVTPGVQDRPTSIATNPQSEQPGHRVTVRIPG